MKCFSRITLAALLVFAMATAAMAQIQAAPFGGAPPAGQGKPLIPVKVQVVIARYEGDKKISSLPYTLSLTANSGDGVRIRMGSQVPIPTTSFQGAQNQTPVTSFAYHNIGTNIDSRVDMTDDGRYRVNVSIEDSSVIEKRAGDAAPTLRTFNTQNTRQFTRINASDGNHIIGFEIFGK